MIQEKTVNGAWNISGANTSWSTNYNEDLLTFFQEQDKNSKLTSASMKALSEMWISMTDFNKEYRKWTNNTASQELSLTQDLVDMLNEVKDDMSWWDYRVAKDKWYTNLLWEWWLWTWDWNATRLKLEQALSSATFTKLSQLAESWVKLWVLSDNDVKMIQNAASSLDIDKMNYSSFSKELNNMITKLQSSLDIWYKKYWMTNPSKKSWWTTTTTSVWPWSIPKWWNYVTFSWAIPITWGSI